MHENAPWMVSRVSRDALDRARRKRRRYARARSRSSAYPLLAAPAGARRGVSVRRWTAGNVHEPLAHTSSIRREVSARVAQRAPGYDAVFRQDAPPTRGDAPRMSRSPSEVGQPARSRASHEGRTGPSARTDSNESRGGTASPASRLLKRGERAARPQRRQKRGGPRSSGTHVAEWYRKRVGRSEPAVAMSR
jgi:hypothetical protein